MTDPTPLAAEAAGADANPEPRRGGVGARAEVAREPEGTPDRICATGARQGRQHAPHYGDCGPDPWSRGLIECERCDDTHEPYCTHGRALCFDCAVWCQFCQAEEADAVAMYEQRRAEWWQ